jgi:site-specific recombinase XerD
MDNTTYDENKKRLYTQKIRALLQELPTCCGTFLRGIESQTSVLTRYGYAVDLKGFFDYLTKESEKFKEKKVTELTLKDIDQVRALDIELYLERLSFYTKGNREIVNQERAKSRKLSSLRSFFKYFYKREMLSSNPASLVDAPKLHDKSIIRLEPNEVANLLDTVDNGDGLTKRQQQYHEFTKVRDLAIITLFLGTGIRISELVGIDIDHVDFSNNEFLITRKGGNQDTLGFGDEVRAALLQYLLQREQIQPVEGS